VRKKSHLANSQIKTVDFARFKSGLKLNQSALIIGSVGNTLIWRTEGDWQSRFRIDLYRFLRDNIPILSACIWTWSRLASAPGHFEIETGTSESQKTRGIEILDRLSGRIYPFEFDRAGALDSFLPLLFSSFFTDGAFAGFLILNPDGSGVERFVPVDPRDIGLAHSKSGIPVISISTAKGEIRPEGDDFYYIGLNADLNHGLGKSIMRSVPFVAYIEQQLIDDMRRTMHNSGYHRLHVKITPPEKSSGESDRAYIECINEYFDQTVSMIKKCDPDDNPVTWDNVQIDYVGPQNVRTATNSWSINHRAMIDEICAGTNLSPFLLGYSHGAAHKWAEFKYDLVMRQVQSVQRQVARFLEWMGNIELALNGFNGRCRFLFENSLSYLASEQAQIRQSHVDNLIKLFSQGLISKDDAVRRAGELI
jgi:hypothetical protein